MSIWPTTILYTLKVLTCAVCQQDIFATGMEHWITDLIVVLSTGCNGVVILIYQVACCGFVTSCAFFVCIPTSKLLDRQTLKARRQHENASNAEPFAWRVEVDYVQYTTSMDIYFVLLFIEKYICRRAPYTRASSCGEITQLWCFEQICRSSMR